VGGDGLSVRLRTNDRDRASSTKAEVACQSIKLYLAGKDCPHVRARRIRPLDPKRLIHAKSTDSSAGQSNP